MTVDTLGLRVRMAQPINKVLRNDFLRHSALVFGATTAVNALNYAFNFALSRRLGVEGFATLSSLVSFLMILTIPMSILTLVVVKYAGVYHAAGDAQRLRRLSQMLLRYAIAVGAAIFVVGALLQGEIASFLRIDEKTAILLCLGIISVGVVTPSLRGVLQGEQDFQRFSSSLLLEIVLKVAFGVSLVYAGMGVAGAMLGWILGAAIALLYTIWAVFRKHGAVAGAEVRLGLDLRRLARTTVGVGLATGLVTFVSFMDVLLVKHYFPAHEAGLYAAVNLTGKVVLFLVAFVPAVVLPKAVEKKTNGDDPHPLLLQAAGITVVLCGFTLCAFGLFPGDVVRALAGRDFVGAAPYVFQYDVAIGLLAIITLLVNYRIGVHRFGFLYGLSAVFIADIIAISLAHRTLWDIIHVLLAGNAVGVAVCCYGIVGDVPRRVDSVSEAS